MFKFSTWQLEISDMYPSQQHLSFKNIPGLWNLTCHLPAALPEYRIGTRIKVNSLGTSSKVVFCLTGTFLARTNFRVKRYECNRYDFHHGTMMSFIWCYEGSKLGNLRQDTIREYAFIAQVYFGTERCM